MKALFTLAKIIGAVGLILSLLAMNLWSRNILEFIAYGLAVLTHTTIIFLANEAENIWLD